VGFMEKQREKSQAWMDERAEHNAQVKEAAGQSTGGCPDTDKHYIALTDKGAINVTTWTGKLNGYYRNGYRLAHVYSIDDNTVYVLEHNHP
jgi:hypothetical protein